ncbi:MAG: hypothetical protein H7Y60_04930 [Rhodospirillaceae bacterium]|nr:hypothetical protein [Rhodospirillales bacterium]
MREKAATLALLAVILGSIGRAVWEWHWAGDLAALALILYLLLEGWSTRSGPRRVLLAALLSAVAALAFHPAPATLLVTAGTLAAAIIGLFASLGFLREAAGTSPLIQRCGKLMVHQPPGRRYAVLSLGSHLIGLVLNFGVLSLLGTMVVRGNTAEAAGGDARIVAIRSQRMFNAILRGFATITIWSPLSVSFAVVQTAVHGLAWWPLLGLQVGLAVIMQALGWAMDRAAFPRIARSEQPTDWRPLLALSALVGTVVAASVLAAELLSVRMVVGAMVVVPPSALIWLWAQHRRAIPALKHLAGQLTVSMPGFRDEVAMLGGAMFLGTVLSAFVPPEETARLIAMAHLPPAVLVVLLSWSVMLFAQLGLSQIVSVTLLGGALTNLSQLGLPPLVMASGLMGAWALSACSTPVGAAVLTIARMGGVEMSVVARQWNGRFVLVGALVLAAWLVALLAILDAL